MADIMTYEEHRGSLARQAGDVVGRHQQCACQLDPCSHPYRHDTGRRQPAGNDARCEDVVAKARKAGAKLELTTDPHEAAEGADLIITDTWVSMGDDQAQRRHNLLAAIRSTMR
jgi:ornithine carbamoyltransferase